MLHRCKLLALIFASLGLWFGLRSAKGKEVVVLKEIRVRHDGPFVVDAAKLEELTWR